MTTRSFFWTALTVSILAISANAEQKIIDVLSDKSVDWGKPQQRLKAAERIRKIEDRNLQAATALAKALGKPITESLPGGKMRWLDGIDENGELVYHETRNINAAISTGANIINSAPYQIDGSGIRVGVWENSSPRVTHQEFNEGATSRINNADSLGFGDHATHVAGTIAAFGFNPDAKGMANQSVIDAYRASNDESRMPTVGATAPGQYDSKVYVSNHSYGPTYGWESISGKWTWKGSGTDQNAADHKFGQYSATAASIDAICYNTPYYLPFWAAGNERVNGPSNGTISRIGGVDVAYNSAIHPPYDNNYRNGFETMGDETISKNVLTVGAVDDAVTGGLRDPSKATIAYFSSTGPTDDGRIKPDLVGNGLSVFSPISTSDTTYSSLQGTSMATPNLTGTAALLVGLYRDLFDGAAMRASTLKGLLIHTATDLGNPGPDYTFGWGLLDGQKAAEVLKRQADFPDLESIIEDQLSTAQPSQTYTFTWDGVSPIRATLCWTDPAGSSTTLHDKRTPDLVNDLNLKLIAPNGTEYFPFVMPFVGTWTVASMSQNATTGVNHTDNVEQVLVQNPGQAGLWQVEVTYAGPLTNNLQDYGLVITGAGVAGAVAFNQASYSVSENAGSATIIVNRAGGSVGAVSVDYSTSNGTATAGSDYTATSGTLSWNDGEMGNKSFTIPILNDAVPEIYAETLFITLSNPIGITISGTNPATLTILDDETFMGVTSFNNGGTFLANTSQNITWESSLGGNVRIELLKNGLLYTTIAVSTPNDGLFNWTIPTLAPTGNDYSIRITSLAGGGQFDDSDGTFSINNLLNGTIYSANMDVNPGWSLQGDWAYGKPAGSGGDPSTGKTGNNVIGYNLNGHYGNNLPEMYATTPAINCSGFTNVQLSFQRWLRVESSNFDKVSIQASNNGTLWTTIWAHSGSTLLDNSWQSVSYDISAVADGQPTVYIRWVMGTTDSSVTHGGWNIDDVLVTGFGEAINPAGEVAFSTANFQVLENAGTATITVNRSGGTSGAISVDYATSNGTATAGSDYNATSGTLNWANGDGAPKTFNIPILNDSIREDFLETVNLTLTNTVGATIAGTNPATLTIQDDDNNPPTVYAGQDKTVALSEVVPWSPSETTTELWLDADDLDSLTLNGNTVSIWEDKSGNARHATASGTAQPTATENGLNNKRVLTFDGSSDVFNVDLNFLKDNSHSAFIVTKPTVFSNIYGAATGGAGAQSLHVGFNGSNYRMNHWGNDYGPVRSANFVSDSANIMNYIWITGVSKQILANGKSEGINTSPSPGTLDNMAGGGRIGRATGHPFFGGDIAEMIICTGTVTPEDRENLEGYLAHKWGLTENLAANHPYKNEPPGGSGMTAVVNLSDATVSDLDSDPFTTQWSLLSGPAPITFGNEATLNTTATFYQEGVYTLRLTADDGRDPASDDVVVTVGFTGLALSIESASISENGGTSNATVTRLGTTGDLVVSLSSSDPSEATVPASVTILDGQSSANFIITAVDDDLVDGTQTVTIIASVEGNPDATATIDILDDEVAMLTLNLAASSVNESDGVGATTATVTRNSVTTAEMIVNLSSSDTSEATVPSTVTIAAGQSTSPSFNIDAVDDAIVDGTQTVTITASYPGHVSGTAILEVTDDPSYTLSVVAGTGGASVTGGGLMDPDASPHAISATASAGYQFTNWTVTSGSGTVDNPNAANTFVWASSDTTVQANFQIRTYTVAYNGNIHTGGTAPGNQTKTHGVDLPLLGQGDLVKTGHTFSGWNTQASGSGTAYPAGATYTANANVTLFAQWIPDTYVVSYNGNDNTGGTAPLDDEKTHDVDLTLATNSGSLVKTGFNFAGWNTSADGSGTDYAAGGTYSDNAPLALYAKWVAGADGTWVQTEAGTYDWGVPGSWVGGNIASGTDRTAFFTPNILGAQTANLDVPITIGNITFTDPVSSHDLTISGASALTLSRSAGTPVIDVTQANRILTIASQISGTNGLQKNGPGTLTLSGSNDYTGGTILNGGTVILGANTHLGATNDAITVNASSALTSAAAANVEYPRAISLGENTLTLRNATNNTTASFSGAMTGAGNISVVSGTTTVALSSAANTFTGDLTLQPAGNSNLFVSFASIGDGGAISMGKGSWRRVVQYNGSANLTLHTRRIDLNADFGGVYDGGGNPINLFENNGAGTVTFHSNLTVANNRTGTFFFGGTNAGNNTFAGLIPNSTGGTLSIGKSGAGKWMLTHDNTFAGSAIASGGMLSVAKIADATVAQPLGQGSIIQIGDRGNTGSLEFTGSTDTTTNKQVQLGGTQNNLTGGGGILNNGSGTLTFTNPTFSALHATATATRTLTLGGSNTGANTISGTIQNNNTAGNGLLALTKSGDGTWILGGDNSYTGITSVTAGKLFINADQSLATGNLTVSANATLGGTGTLGGNATISNNGRLEFNLSTPAGSHNPLDLVAGKGLTFSGASTLTITTTGDAQPGTYTLVTGGNNITGAAPATVNLPAGWAANVSISGNSLLLHVTSTGQSLFAAWADQNGLSGADAAPDANPDGDSLTNLQEFAFGTNPSVAAGGPIVFEAGGAVITPGTPIAMNMAEGVDPGFNAVFARRKNHQAAGLIYTVEFSANLADWVISAQTPAILTGAENDSDIEAVSVPFPMTIPTPGGDEKPKFFRVGVAEN